MNTHTHRCTQTHTKGHIHGGTDTGAQTRGHRHGGTDTGHRHGAQTRGTDTDTCTCTFTFTHRHTGGGGGGGGVSTYIFLIRMYPVKTKGEPKAGAGFLTNYQPKSGANHICYKNATQSQGNLVSVQIDILLVPNKRGGRLLIFDFLNSQDRLLPFITFRKPNNK